MKIFYLSLLALTFFTSMAKADGDGIYECDVYCHGVNRKTIQTKNLVCVPYTQPEIDNVVLYINLKNGVQRPYRREMAAKIGFICVGRNWVRDADTMLMCNGNNRAPYPHEDTQQVARKPKLSRQNEACLYGKEWCGQNGYKTIDNLHR